MARRARRLLLAPSVAVLTALGLAIASPSAIASASAGTATTVADEANWILSAQLPDGAIAVWPDRPQLRLIWPYLANYAASGLARATEATGNPTYVQHAWAYLQWYSSVEEPGTGYVTDYDITGGTTPVSDGHYDSTDAYAGTFLSAVWDAYAASQDTSALESIAGGIARAVHAIATTQQSDGLTWATPSWQVAYLMDNAEAYGGLVAAGRLAAVLGDTALENEATVRANLMQQGVASLWDPSTGAYDWAKQANGWQHQTQWTNLYPDAMEQVAAVAWGLVPADRAQQLMTTFGRMHSQWTSPTATDDYLNGATVSRQPVGYWPMAALGFTEVGADPTAASGASSILIGAAQVGYGWPYTTGDAGQEILSLTGGTALAPPPGGPTGPPPPSPGPGSHNPPPTSGPKKEHHAARAVMVRTVDDASFRLQRATSSNSATKQASHTTLLALVPRDTGS